MSKKINEPFKGCQNTHYDIKTRFVQEVKVEPSILVNVTGWTEEEILELYNDVNKSIMTKQKILERELSGEELDVFADNFGNIFDAMNEFAKVSILGFIEWKDKNYPQAVVHEGLVELFLRNESLVV